MNHLRKRVRTGYDQARIGSVLDGSVRQLSGEGYPHFFLLLQIYQFLQTELPILEAPYRYTDPGLINLRLKHRKQSAEFLHLIKIPMLKLSTVPPVSLFLIWLDFALITSTCMRSLQSVNAPYK